MTTDVNADEFFDAIGGRERAARLTPDEKAEALETHMAARVGRMPQPEPAADVRYPTVAELDAVIGTRTYRRGVGKLFAGDQPIRALQPMPDRPTLADFFRLRFAPADHGLQSAALALRAGLDEEVVLACLLHDTAQAFIRAEHGWWGAQLYEPYVPPRTAFAIRYHQALRFYPDPSVGYEYPDIYRKIFGVDYEPTAHVRESYRFVRGHRWYMDARMVTVNDLYSFDPTVQVTLNPFLDIIGRHFSQPPEGLGNDNSPSAHMWRVIARPDAPL